MLYINILKNVLLTLRQILQFFYPPSLLFHPHLISFVQHHHILLFEINELLSKLQFLLNNNFVGIPLSHLHLLSLLHHHLI